MRRLTLTLAAAGLGLFLTAGEASACHKMKCACPAPAPAPVCKPAKVCHFKMPKLSLCHKKMVAPCETMVYTAPVMATGQMATPQK